MALTDIKIRTTKSQEKTIKLSDGGGLQLWIEPTGGKLWRLAYRYEGKQKKLSLGAYPTVSLKDAREKRDQAKVLLASGNDPGQQRKIDRLVKANASALSFSAIAEELLTKKKREGKASATIGKREWLYSIANDDIGSRVISEISAAEVLAILKKIEAKGHFETAKRMRTAVGEVFRYAIATGRATNDPTGALRGAVIVQKVKHRSAIIEPKAFGALLRAIWEYEGQPETKAALQLIAYLHSRPGELRQAKWSEFDLEAAGWTIPAARMKMRREHKAPLSSQAIAILKALYDITGRAELVFPGLRTPKRPISENTLNAALRRMGFTQDEMTSHGFRASFSTLANESGKWSVDAIERQLAHQDQDPVRRAYARGAHWDERQRLSQWWADYCDELRLKPHR